MSAPSHGGVVILDYGSQYTQLIARRVRELGIYSIILPGDSSLDRIESYAPGAVILSGGPSSVYDTGAPQLPAGYLDLQAKRTLPTLGICYGMQLLAKDLGGKVERAQVREYGRMEVIGDCGKRFQAWMSHGDEVKELPAGFSSVSRTASGTLASMFDERRKIVALQFHPEVTHTENGIQFLKDFLFDVAGLKSNWNMGSVLEEQLKIIREKVAPDEHVLCALSGGVDSAVAAILVHRAVGDRLHCVFVDHGLLRHDERARVLKLFQERLKLPVICFDASAAFLGKLAGVTDPEKKRKIIGAEFINSFEVAAKDLQQKLGRMPAFLGAGHALSRRD